MSDQETPRLTVKIALEAWEAAGKARVLACSRAFEAAYQLFNDSTVEAFNDLVREQADYSRAAEEYGRTREIYLIVSGVSEINRER